MGMTSIPMDFTRRSLGMRWNDAGATVRWLDGRSDHWKGSRDAVEALMFGVLRQVLPVTHKYLG